MNRTFLHVATLSLLAPGCPGYSTKADTGDTGNEAYLDTATGECVWEWSRLNPANNAAIYAACTVGTFDPSVPEEHLVVPCYGAGVNNPALWDAAETDLQNGTFMGEAGTWLCSRGEGGGGWQARFETPGVCEDHLLIGVNYVIEGPYSLPELENPWGPDCPYILNYYGGTTTTTTSYPSVRTGTATCTPGTGTFQLAVREVSAPSATGEVAMRLMPIADEATPYPERAWLRRVEVVDWGDLDNLRIAPFGEYLAFSDETIGNGLELAPPSTVATLPSGAAPMGAMIGAEKVDLSEEVVLPTVELSWTCGVDPGSPHFTVVSGSDGYVGSLPAGLGKDQRVVFWVDTTRQELRIAPEGRFDDYVRAVVTPLDGDAWSFEGRVSAYDAEYEGVITRIGTNLELTNASVTMGGTTFAVPDTTLTPL